MEKIFSYNVDIDKTAYELENQTASTIHDMMIIADGYMKGSDNACTDCLQDNGDKGGYCSFPNAVSANHAIELYLKSINGSLNMLLNEESFVEVTLMEADMEHSKETYDRF